MAIHIQAEGLEEESLEQQVDASIEEFNQYFQQELKNEALTPAERAIIKTYMHFNLVRKGG